MRLILSRNIQARKKVDDQQEDINPFDDYVMPRGKSATGEHVPRCGSKSEAFAYKRTDQRYEYSFQPHREESTHELAYKRSSDPKLAHSFHPHKGESRLGRREQIFEPRPLHDKKTHAGYPHNMKIEKMQNENMKPKRSIVMGVASYQYYQKRNNQEPIPHEVFDIIPQQMNLKQEKNDFSKGAVNSDDVFEMNLQEECKKGIFEDSFEQQYSRTPICTYEKFDMKSYDPKWKHEADVMFLMLVPKKSKRNIMNWFKKEPYTVIIRERSD